MPGSTTTEESKRKLTDKLACMVDGKGEIVTYHLESGLMISGWSQMKVGLMQSTSI